MYEELQKIIYKVTGARKIAMDTDFIRDLSFDSFDIINIVAEIEGLYQIEIPIRDIWDISTVKDAIAYLTKRGVGKTS